MNKFIGKNLALHAAELIAEKKGSDTVILDLRKFQAPADYFVIATAGAEPHLKALCDHIDDSTRKAGTAPFRTDGVNGSGWIILDYFDVMIHLFLKDRRAYYDIEDLYADAPRLSQKEKKAPTPRKAPSKTARKTVPVKRSRKTGKQ